MKITQLFPKGRTKAFTLSYDDGVNQDRRLVELFNKYGLKCTFNLNSGLLSEDSFWVNNGITIKHINKADVLDLYAGHEVAVHGLTHQNPTAIPKQCLIEEILQDKKNLEAILGYPVRGMAYAYGCYNDTVIEVLKTLGVEYSRTVFSHENFYLPKNPLEWHPTCHHSHPKLMQFAKSFIENPMRDISLFYLWGHSYEFDVHNNWDVIENFCELISNKDDIWYATNIEILDYINAYKNLKFSAESSMVYNPSAISVWISVEDTCVEIKPGEMKKL